MKTKIALLLIDIQNDYFKGGLNPLVGSSEAGLKAQVILQHFRLQCLPIIHIQHISTKQGATFFLPNTKGAKIHENVAPLKEENVIIKHTPNSFHRTILDNLLRSQDITDLVICGMMTQMCVDATVRAAKDLGYNCIIIADACATKDLEFQDQIIKAKDVHAAFLSSLNHYYSTIITTKEYINHLTNKKKDEND